MEYRVKNLDYFMSPEELEAWLKPWAEDGWTIAAMNDEYLIMQRPAEPEILTEAMTEALTNKA
jgi:hypothetical protein